MLSVVVLNVVAPFLRLTLSWATLFYIRSPQNEAQVNFYGSSYKFGKFGKFFKQWLWQRGQHKKAVGCFWWNMAERLV